MGGDSGSWSWELFEPFDVERNLIASAVDRVAGYFAVEYWTDHFVHPHVFGKAFRLVGGEQVNCGSGDIDSFAYSNATGSATWDAANAITLEGGYVSLDDLRIFSCSGEFDLNWPP